MFSCIRSVVLIHCSFGACVGTFASNGTLPPPWILGTNRPRVVSRELGCAREFSVYIVVVTDFTRRYFASGKSIPVDIIDHLGINKSFHTDKCYYCNKFSVLR
jgi:hypothetical protein